MIVLVEVYMFKLFVLSWVMNFEVEIFFLDDSNVTSCAFRIHADIVCCGCDGRCEASVSWLCRMCGLFR